MYKVVAIGLNEELLSRPLLLDTCFMFFVGLTLLVVFLLTAPAYLAGDYKFLLLSAP